MTYRNWRNSSIGPRGMDYLWWNWDRTWLSPSDKIRVLSPILQPKYAEYKPKTLIAPRDEMRVLEVDVQFFRTDYGLQKWISPTQDIRQLTFVLELLCDEYRPEYDLPRMKEYNHWPSRYSVSVPNIGTKLDSRPVMNFRYCTRPTT